MEELVLKLKLQYFGHLMQRANSLEKTLMLGKTVGRRRRGWQSMRWLVTPLTQWTGQQTWGDSEGQGSLARYSSVQFSSVQLLSHFRLFATPWTTTCQASLSITNSRSPVKPMSIKLVMPSNRLILCRPLLLLPSIPPSIRVFSNESALRMRWPKYWSFSFNFSPSIEHSGLISFRML